MKPIAIQTSTTSHGGVINPIAESKRPLAAGIKIVIQTDTIACPLPGHGTTTILTSSGKAKHNTIGVVYEGCTTSCGATIQTGTGDSTVQISELP